MPTSPWPTVVVGGVEYWEIDAKLRVAKESDPNSQVLVLIATPNGGWTNLALVQGDPGQHAEIDEDINLTPLEPEDSTPDSASWTVLTPPDAETPGVYRLNLSIHKGAKGDDGDTVLDPSDYEATLGGQILVVNSAVDAFEIATQKSGMFTWPATIASTPSGNANYTLGVCSITARNNDCVIIPFGYVIITGTGPDVAVDFLARLNGETGGNIIGKCPGVAGIKDRLLMQSGVVAGSSPGYNVVEAGNSATVHFRVERASGTDTYTTSDTSTMFGILVVDI